LKKPIRLEAIVVILINGAASELGIDLVRRFAKEKAQVIAVAGRSDDMERLLEEASENVQVIMLDGVACKEIVNAALARIPESWNDIDVLINNATLALGSQSAHKASLDHWDAMIEMNCTATVAMTREILPRMLARRSGTILNLSSAREQGPTHGSNVYGATVAFVHQYTLGLISSLSNTGVRATCIAPDRDASAALLTVDSSSRQLHRSPRNAHDSMFIPSRADIVETTYWIATLPSHININYMELAQTGELFSPLTVEQR
jgi:NADP-dependent 3-hydroxy acid dehydrogenase YdfG